jgi:hypothetical protein
MGQFIVKIDAVGNHGCMRELKDGEFVVGCEKPHCTDCMVRELVRRLKRSGATVAEATITHWPTQEVPIVDDLVSGYRSGNF